MQFLHDHKQRVIYWNWIVIQSGNENTYKTNADSNYLSKSTDKIVQPWPDWAYQLKFTVPASLFSTIIREDDHSSVEMKVISWESC